MHATEVSVMKQRCKNGSHTILKVIQFGLLHMFEPFWWRKKSCATWNGLQGRNGSHWDVAGMIVRIVGTITRWVSFRLVKCYCLSRSIEGGSVEKKRCSCAKWSTLESILPAFAFFADVLMSCLLFCGTLAMIQIRFFLVSMRNLYIFHGISIWNTILIELPYSYHVKFSSTVWQLDVISINSPYAYDLIVLHGIIYIFKDKQQRSKKVIIVLAHPTWKWINYNPVQWITV